mgnify:CR=1 FL=1
MPDIIPSMGRKGYYDDQGNWVEPTPIAVNPDVPDRNDRGSSRWQLPEPDTTIYDYPPNSRQGDYGTEDPQLQPPDVLLRKYLRKKLDASQRQEGYINEYRPERAANKADDVNSLGSALMKSAAQVGTLFGKRADASPVEDMADDMRRTGSATVDDFYAQEKQRGDRRNATISSAQDAIEGKKWGGDEPISQVYREQLKRVFPGIEKNIPGFDKLSAGELEKYLPILSKYITDQQQAEFRKAQTTTNETRYQKGEGRKDKQEERQATLDEIRLEQQKEANRIAEEKRKQDAIDKADKKAAKKEKDAKLSEKQAIAMGDYDEAINLLDDIIARKPRFDTGKVSGLQNSAAQQLGQDDPETTAFRGDTNITLANLVHKLSGSAASNLERQNLMGSVPTFNDNDETFLQKAFALRKRMQIGKKARLDNLAKIGKDTSSFMEEKEDDGQLPKESRRDKLNRLKRVHTPAKPAGMP